MSRAYRSNFTGRTAPTRSRKSPEIKPFHECWSTFAGKTHCIKDNVLLDEYFNEISSRLYNAWDRFSSEVITDRSIFPIRQVGGIDGGLA